MRLILIWMTIFGFTKTGRYLVLFVRFTRIVPCGGNIIIRTDSAKVSAENGLIMACCVESGLPCGVAFKVK